MRNKLVKISLLLIALLMLFCIVSCGDNRPPEQILKVTVYFDEGRGSFADDDFDGAMQVDQGTAISQYPEVTRKGYVFTGWYFDEDCTELCPASNKFTKSVTLYAGWEKETFFTVKFDTSRANYGETVADQKVLKGTKITKPTDPQRAGCVFVGWCVGTNETLFWDFDNDVVTRDVTLTALFKSENDPGTGNNPGGTEETCKHDFVRVEDKCIEPTCERNGRITQKCTICRKTVRITHEDDPTLLRKEHLELEEKVEADCGNDGYKRVYCPNGCGLSKTTVLKATGKHQYDEENGWQLVIAPTKYVAGVWENKCSVCGGAPKTDTQAYSAENKDFFAENVNISYLYTGGSYVNESFVNVAPLGRILATSYFDGTKASYAIDGSNSSFWNADTYVDGANYTSDWLELEFAKNYDIGAINLTVPNYTAWELGEDCYVSYEIEYWDTTSGAWVSLGELSDKEVVSAGMKCELLVELESPINTNKVRAKVTHASRYAPAVVYEMQTFAKTEGVIRYPVAINGQVTVTASGKYNDWASGASALTDNTTATHWFTDAKHNSRPWAIYEFSKETYVACVQISTTTIENRAILIEVYENGEWATFTTCKVPAKGVTNETVISNANGMCTFNINVEKTVSKMRFTITNEPQYWESKIYDITPYSIVESYSNKEQPITGCSHNNPIAGDVIAPTCDAIGYTVLNCPCGAVIKTKATDAIGHNFGKYTIATAATATTIGTKTSTCKNGDCGAVSTITYEENYNAPVITPYLHGAPAAWAQTLDDGNYLPTYEWSNKYFAKYGAGATVMMSITYSDSLVATWNEHFSRGVFDLGSHSYNHTASYAGNASPGTLLGEVVNAQYWFRHNFKGQHILGFAAPLGTTSTSVAEYLTGPLAANRNGGDTGIFYNTIDQLTERKIWGDLNSYISKADQTEGIYVFVNKNGGAFEATYTPKVDENGEPVLDTDGNQINEVTYTWNAEINKGNADKNVVLRNVWGEYIEVKSSSINLVFDWNEMTFVDKGLSAGTYFYIAEDYKFEFRDGSYNLEGEEYKYVSDDSGEYVLAKITVGSYEKGVEKLFSVGGFTVECLHEVAENRDFIGGKIHSSYVSTISKLEHITKFGIWAPTYNELVQYLKEYQRAEIETLERTDTSITISVTDDLDDYMFNQALTIKVDIPDSWTTVTATQNGVEIPLVAIEDYRKTKEMSKISCAIDDGYLYIDVIPDGGEIVITVGEKDDSISDYKESVDVSFEPGEGELKSNEYETRVVVGGTLEAFPKPTRDGFKLAGWYLDAEFTTQAIEGVTVFSEDTILYAKWEELPKCTDGTYDHDWTNWLPSTEVTGGETRTCKDCGAVENRVVITEEEDKAPSTEDE